MPCSLREFSLSKHYNDVDQTVCRLLQNSHQFFSCYEKMATEKKELVQADHRIQQALVANAEDMVDLMHAQDEDYWQYAHRLVEFCNRLISLCGSCLKKLPEDMVNGSLLATIMGELVDVSYTLCKLTKLF